MGKKDKKEEKNDKNIDETVMYKPVKNKKKKGEKKKHPGIKRFFKVVLVMMILCTVIVGRNIRCNFIPLHMGRLGNG